MDTGYMADRKLAGKDPEGAEQSAGTAEIPGTVKIIENR
jgi:hypothetical protein